MNGMLNCGKRGLSPISWAWFSSREMGTPVVSKFDMKELWSPRFFALFTLLCP